jgi:hypothetical protein
LKVTKGLLGRDARYFGKPRGCFLLFDGGKHGGGIVVADAFLLSS